MPENAEETPKQDNKRQKMEPPKPAAPKSRNGGKKVIIKNVPAFFKEVDILKGIYEENLALKGARKEEFTKKVQKSTFPDQGKT